MKVYVVTDGNYSDFHICAISSTPEKGEEARRLLRADSIDEWEVDNLPEHPKDCLYWRVRMWRDGNDTTVFPSGPPSMPDERDVLVCRDNSRFYFVWARDEEHAIKIVNEKRVQAIADGSWPAALD